jgi:hypothetical protein
MRMREDHGIDRRGVERQIPVPLEGMLPPALRESAVYQQVLPPDP